MRDYLRAIRYVGPYRWLFVLSVVSAVLAGLMSAASFGSVVPFLETIYHPDELARVIGKWRLAEVPILGGWLSSAQQMLAARPERFLALIIAGIAVATCLRGLFSFANDFIAGYVSTRAVLDLSRDLFRRVLFLPLGFFTKENTGKTISRFTNDTGILQRGLDVLFGRLVVEPVYLLNFLAVALVFDWRLSRFRVTLLASILGPLVAFAALYLGKRIRKSSERALVHKADVVGALQESIAGMNIVKGFRLESYEEGRFRRSQAKVLKYLKRVIAADAATQPIIEVIAVMGGGLLLAACAWWFRFSEFGVASGFLLVFISYYKIYDSIRRIAKANNVVQMGAAGSARVFALMDQHPEPEDAPGAVAIGPIQSELAFHDVSFRYGDGNDTISNVTFSVRRGEVAAIVGMSGAGKTSLANLIPRFYEPTSGKITIDGLDTRRVKIGSLRDQIGIVTQETFLFNDTVRNNIAVGRPGCTDDEIVAAAKAANAHNFIEKLPKRYGTLIGERGYQLSGGERQRIALARAIVRQPSILILDEATSAVDLESEALIQESLAEFVRGRTTLIIAHRLSTIEMANKIVVLREGAVEAIGTHRELLEKSRVYSALYARQFRDAVAGADVLG